MRAYTTQVSNPWYMQEKLGSPHWPIAQNVFWIQITRRIRNRIWEKCSKWNRGPNEVDWQIKPEDENLTLLSLEVRFIVPRLFTYRFMPDSMTRRQQWQSQKPELFKKCLNKDIYVLLFDLIWFNPTTLYRWELRIWPVFYYIELSTPFFGLCSCAFALPGNLSRLRFHALL